MQGENAAIFAGIEPKGVWNHFHTITTIGRPSGKEEAISAELQAWAKKLGFTCSLDTTKNLCVRVPASPGRESAPVVVLQGHIDMVVSNAKSIPPGYDAATGKLHLIRKQYDDGEYIEADYTTLGADNGIAIAMMCAVAEDKSAQHGPLELLMTVDEETGLTGALNVDPALLKGRIMLNLDSEDDHILYVGCAGGTDLRIRWTHERTPVPAGWAGFKVELDKLRGGHSGAEIDKNRLNAHKALARLLDAASEKAPIRIAEINGGDRHNAIARFASAEVWVAPEAKGDFEKRINDAHATLAEQYRKLEPSIVFTLTPLTISGATAFSAEDSRRLIGLLQAIPSGIVFMSQDLPNLVETSNNLAIVTTKGNDVEIQCSLRSSVDAAMVDLANSIKAMARLAGGVGEVLGSYPGWEVNLDSDLLKKAKGVYAKVFGADPEVAAIHAGLECGVIAARVPEPMDVISFGPNIKGAHAPGERVSIPSVAKSYGFLKALLDDLSK